MSSLIAEKVKPKLKPKAKASSNENGSATGEPVKKRGPKPRLN